MFLSVLNFFKDLGTLEKAWNEFVLNHWLGAILVMIWIVFIYGLFDYLIDKFLKTGKFFNRKGGRGC